MKRRVFPPMRIGAALLMSGVLLAGCAEMIGTVDPGQSGARVRFRLAEPGDVIVSEATPAPCFYTTDATVGRVVQVSYNTRAIQWIVESRLSRLGMPGGDQYPSISYAEARVRAGVPIALRFMLMEGQGTMSAFPRYAQWNMTLAPGEDYEILVGNGLGSIAVSRIVNGEYGHRLVPDGDAMRTPYCPS
ncbi:hypothetical protein CURE108131_18800 [Cupriavidus respiraculi]|uniref:Lipoprotein n=1 Tax=Cupriavidus respiraculi TaxID=195930 RepID=A0ABM8XUL9_9BURK|nr:hypothetical protein [Cupriavidus respiraculi]MBY4949557.1 hypothetical protein [Cupriavidus respiraculi]CAG9184073.1 hypothetical protein LMG21510_05016 [Cupriavidus respiraculi]